MIRRMEKWGRGMLFCLVCSLAVALPQESALAASAAEDEVVLRICNWEEYIDLGDWDEEETIDLESGDIIG